jgi:integrase
MPALDGDGPIDPKLLTRSVARCGARRKRQKVAPFNVHDLRRTVRTGLGRLGVRPDIAELVIGHKRSKLIETYDRHRYPEERRDALERWSAHLATLVVKA